MRLQYALNRLRPTNSRLPSYEFARVGAHQRHLRLRRPHSALERGPHHDVSDRAPMEPRRHAWHRAVADRFRPPRERRGAEALSGRWISSELDANSSESLRMGRRAAWARPVGR